MHWYEWVFSGIGATLLALLVSYLAAKSRAGRNASRVLSAENGGIALSGSFSASPVAVGENIAQSVEVHHHHHGSSGEMAIQQWLASKPSPGQIIRDIDSAAPFDQEQVRKKYQGLPIRWEVQYSSISREEVTGKWLVIAEADWSSVVCHLTSVPKELQVARSGARLRIEGEIKHVWSRNISVGDDPKIQVLS